jgi:lipoprotein signal peptidase
MKIVNPGASFGLNFEGIGWIQMMLLIVCGWVWWKEKSAWGWLLIFIGGFLNYGERLFWGGVRDYWQIPGIRLYNNLNDYLIAIGAGQVIWYLLWKVRRK